MAQTTQDTLQERMQALVDRVLGDTDVAVHGDPSFLELRVRVLRLVNPLFGTDEEDEEHVPRSDIVVIN